MRKAPGLVSFLCDNREKGDVDNSRWKTLMVICNSRGSAVKIGLPDGEWEVLSDEKNSFLWKDAVCAGKQILAGEKSVTVLGSRKVILPESVSGDSAEKRCENRGRESAEKICESGKEGRMAV